MDFTTPFANVTDPRVEGRTKHLLIDIIGIALLAVIAECDEWEDIVDWARSKEDDLRKYFGLPNGIPSHDTFERVFSLLDPIEFQKSFIVWVKSIFGSENKFVHIDGKSLKGSKDETQGKRMLHMVGAWASEQHLLLAQLRSEEKSNEITAIPELLKMLDLKESTVTIDAMGCQKDIASGIIHAEGDYVLAVKNNQKSLYEQIENAFQHQPVQSTDETTEKDHGRIEVRQCRVITKLEFVEEAENWSHCQSIIEVQRTRTEKGITTEQKAYYISSHSKDAAFMNKVIRSHWSIENELHWTLDVVFGEDKSRKRKKNEGENFSFIRRMALNILKSYHGDKRSIRRRRKMASYQFEYLENLLKI
jgi:predicted transposase YbfD/YdcC